MLPILRIDQKNRERPQKIGYNGRTYHFRGEALFSFINLLVLPSKLKQENHATPLFFHFPRFSPCEKQNTWEIIICGKSVGHYDAVITLHPAPKTKSKSMYAVAVCAAKARGFCPFHPLSSLGGNVAETGIVEIRVRSTRPMSNSVGVA